MSTTDLAETGPPTLFRRARGILIAPAAEWRRIAEEEPTALLKPYAAPLAVVAAAAGALRELIGQGFTLGATWTWLPVAAALQVVFAVLGVMLVGWLANTLAPRFGGERNGDRAHQLAAYASTAALVAGATVIVPVIWPLLLMAGFVYSAILFGMGARALLPMPEERVPTFALSIIGLTALIAAVAAMVIGPLLDRGRDALKAVTPAIATTTATTAPQQEPQLSEVERALARLSQADAGRAPIDPARLEEQLPQTLPGGFVLSAVSSGAPQGLPQAHGLYSDGAGNMSIQLVHLRTVSDIPAAAAALDVAEATAPGYVRRTQLDGRLFIERADGDRVHYVVIGRGVALRVEGSSGVTLDRARSAVETIGVQRLEHLFGS